MINKLSNVINSAKEKAATGALAGAMAASPLMAGNANPPHQQPQIQQVQQAPVPQQQFFTSDPNKTNPLVNHNAAQYQAPQFNAQFKKAQNPLLAGRNLGQALAQPSASNKHPLFGAAPTNAASVDVAQYLKDNPANTEQVINFDYAINDFSQTLVYDLDETLASADKITPQQVQKARDFGYKVNKVIDGKETYFSVERPGALDFIQAQKGHGHDLIVSSRNKHEYVGASIHHSSFKPIVEAYGGGTLLGEDKMFDYEDRPNTTNRVSKADKLKGRWIKATSGSFYRKEMKEYKSYLGFIKLLEKEKLADDYYNQGLKAPSLSANKKVQAYIEKNPKMKQVSPRHMPTPWFVKDTHQIAKAVSKGLNKDFTPGGILVDNKSALNAELMLRSRYGNKAVKFFRKVMTDIQAVKKDKSLTDAQKVTKLAELKSKTDLKVKLEKFKPCKGGEDWNNIQVIVDPNVVYEANTFPRQFFGDRPEPKNQQTGQYKWVEQVNEQIARAAKSPEDQFWYIIDRAQDGMLI